MLSIVFVVFWIRIESKRFFVFREFQVFIAVHDFLKSWFMGFLMVDIFWVKSQF